MCTEMFSACTADVCLRSFFGMHLTGKLYYKTAQSCAQNDDVIMECELL